MIPKRVVLASSSPRRREILERLGVRFEVIPSDADEKIDENIPCSEFVMTLSRRKGEGVKDMLLSRGEDISDTMIIACDTVVYYDKNIIGKPESDLEARLTIGMLSDSWHDVYSGLYITYGGIDVCDYDVTHVKFADIPERDIERYVATGEPRGKAGSYAIQGKAGAFVEKTDGDVNNVIGFPLSLFCRKLKENFGISVFDLGDEK